MSLLTKIFGKKKIWKLFRKMIRSIDPRLYDDIKDLVIEADIAMDQLSGAEKRQSVLDSLLMDVNSWLANIFIEFVVGELIENGKPRYVNLLNKIK